MQVSQPPSRPAKNADCPLLEKTSTTLIGWQTIRHISKINKIVNAENALSAINTMWSEVTNVHQSDEELLISSAAENVVVLLHLTAVNKYNGKAKVEKRQMLTRKR